MRRFTKHDWRAINAALSLVLAGGPDDASMTEAEYQQCVEARDKVWQRLEGDDA